MTTETAEGPRGAGVAAQDTLTITDNRTGKTYEVPIEDGTIRATELRKIKTGEDDFGIMTYDPAYMNTASCRVRDHVHRWRQGHPQVPRIPDRAARREVELPGGRLPTDPRRAFPQAISWRRWEHEITIHTFVHENIKEFMQGFRYDAHPMGMLLASVGALSTFYPEASSDQGPRACATSR